MKLEIKHLTPYLPFGLNIMFNKKYKGELVGLFANKWNLAEIKFEFGNDRKDIEVCFPVLKPLSDLTNEHLRAEMYRIKHVSHIDWTTHERECIIKDNGFDYWLKDVPYAIIRWLFENHYDVFGLIEKGLAIDINTLK